MIGVFLGSRNFCTPKGRQIIMKCFDLAREKERGAGTTEFGGEAAQIGFRFRSLQEGAGESERRGFQGPGRRTLLSTEISSVRHCSSPWRNWQGQVAGVRQGERVEPAVTQALSEQIQAG